MNKNKGIMFTFVLVLSCFILFAILVSNSLKPKTKAYLFPHGYNNPRDLFYSFLIEDGAYISFGQKEHFEANGYLATDLGTNHRNISLYAPSYDHFYGEMKDEERTYKVKLVNNYNTMGQTIELHWKEKGRNLNFAIGHVKEAKVKDGDKVRTGDRIGISGGCAGDLVEGEKSTGCHVHFEFRVDGMITPYPSYMYSNHGEELAVLKEYQMQQNDAERRIREGLSLKATDPIYDKYENGKLVSAIHNAENGRCAKNCKRSNKNAVGPLQFVPNTWFKYGCDGNGDGYIDVENLSDAVCGASNFLQVLYDGEKKENPALGHNWLIWKTACRYNSGWNTWCTHDTTGAGIQNYADKVMQNAL